MELILETLGAEIADYERQDLCCGASLGYNAGRINESLQILAEKLRWIQEADAQAIALACPACMTQFGRGQVLLRRRTPGPDPLPVYHVTELIAYALGVGGIELDVGSLGNEEPAAAIGPENQMAGAPAVDARAPRTGEGEARLK
jgi:heterodisulfide reductase subunit B